MESQKLYNYLVIFANAATVAGLLLVAIELNQNTQQLSLELEWQTSQKMFENNRDFAGDRAASIYAKAVKDPEQLTFEEFMVAGAVFLNLMNVWEDKYFLYSAGLADREEWQQYIDEDIGITLGNRFGLAFWRATKGFYEQEMVVYVDSKISALSSGDTLRWYEDTMSALTTLED